MIEADSLSLMLASLRLTDCLGLTTAQVLAHDQSHGIVALDHELLRFSREAGVVVRRHLDVPPSVKLVIAELRRGASKQRAN